MTKFKKGQSGNPKGRPRGIPDKRTIYRETLHKNAGKIIEAVIEKALEGDITAMRICVDRIIPTLKAGDSSVNVNLSGNLADQGQQVLSSLADGSLSPGEAVTVMNTLQAQAKLVESDELIERIERLEKAK